MTQQINSKTIRLAPEYLVGAVKSEAEHFRGAVWGGLVAAAHNAAVQRKPTGTTITLVETFSATGDYERAVSAATLTLGGKHSPIYAAWAFLKGEYQVLTANRREFFIPGFGGSESDTELVGRLWSNLPDSVADAIGMFQDEWPLKAEPNLALYTALMSIHLTSEFEVKNLMLSLRLTPWARLIQRCVKTGTPGWE